MSKHTPGPWEYGGPVKRKSLLKKLTGSSRPNGISDTVWEVGAEGERIPPGLAVVNIRDDHAEANARLIAAAPDLLAACKLALDPVQCQLDHHGICQAHSLCNPCEQKLLREAIAKAEGTSHA